MTSSGPVTLTPLTAEEETYLARIAARAYGCTYPKCQNQGTGLPGCSGICSKPLFPKADVMTDRASCALYRALSYSKEYGGYVVYRHCFGPEADFNDGVEVHRVATFATELEAEHYARFRNKLVDEQGSDRIDQARRNAEKTKS